MTLPPHSAPRCVAALWILILFGTLGCKPNPAEKSDPREAATVASTIPGHDYAEDVARIYELDKGLRSTLDFARAHPEIFPNAAGTAWEPQHRESLLTIFRTLLDYLRALDEIKSRYRHFYRIPIVSEKDRHLHAFLVGYMAWVVQYKSGLEFIDLTVPNAHLEKVLDESIATHEVPAGMFGALKFQVIHVKAVSRLLGGSAYLKIHSKTLRQLSCQQEPWCRNARDLSDQYSREARAQLRERASIQFAYNTFDIARDLGLEAWFPVQKHVAQWMGDTKTRRKDSTLIRMQQLDTMATQMQPGDIVLARQNWYLSNVGLPGFWPHAELFVGSVEELSAYFDDPTVDDFFAQRHGQPTLVDYLKTTHPRAWRAYTFRGEDRQPKRVLEALSEGVVFRSLYQAIGVDYAAVLRPARTKLEKAIAIERAFRYFGRPYDFNFDFATEETIVCTELVFKAWQPGPDSRGLPFETRRIMGRTTLPANDIARQFNQLSPNDLGFVYFLDGRESDRSAVVATEAEFRNSWRRPKWDVVQQ